MIRGGLNAREGERWYPHLAEAKPRCETEVRVWYELGTRQKWGERKSSWDIYCVVEKFWEKFERKEKKKGKLGEFMSEWEKSKNIKIQNIWIKFQNMGKHETLKSPKNEVTQNDSKKFSKMINIILRYLVKSDFRNSFKVSK